MVLEVNKFCAAVSNPVTFANMLQTLESEVTRRVSEQEKMAWVFSYPKVSQMLQKATQKNPKLAKAHISTTNLLLEYKLPGSSSWCDLVLIGKNNDRSQVLVLELKDYVKNSKDRPGTSEGLIFHGGEEMLHPSDQVKGYSEYCKYFHSAVLEYNAQVNGCVYFTRDIDTAPYKAFPNDILTKSYPVYNHLEEDELAEFVAKTIQEPDVKFLASFVNGYYQQDKNILKQVAETLKAVSKKDKNARPFVLLQEQRTGLYKTLVALEESIKTKKKHVIIVEGPPGSGKSAVAVNLWIESALRYREKGNVVYVTTSGSQNDNWDKTFYKYSKTRNVIIKANSFNPGMDGTKMKKFYLPFFANTNPEYLFQKDDGDMTLRYDLFREYLQFMKSANLTSKDYKENHHFLSIVDEAHALINPIAPNFKSNKSAGWCVQMGPQAWHIINESLVTVFFTDSLQSFRDNETTTKENLIEWADELGANVTTISLEDQQFRCGGSVDFVEWLEGIFSKEPIKNHSKWGSKFEFKLVDYPSDVDEYLSSKKTKSKRILSSYTEEWVSSGKLDKMHFNIGVPYDFDLPDKNGERWQRYWNFGEDKGYDIYVQGREGSMMSIDPLCEVGCAYTVRGFDYDYVGVLWLGDIIRRNGKWEINPRKNLETAIEPTRRRALDEQADIQGIKKAGISMKKIPAKMKNYVVDDAPDESFTKLLFDKIAHAYRILLTRGIKGACLYIQDEETREYVRGLLEDIAPIYDYDFTKHNFVKLIQVAQGTDVVYQILPTDSEGNTIS